MNFSGIIIGLITFLIIGLLHPIVIKSEYYFGTKVWPIFLILGLICIIFSLLSNCIEISACLGILGFSLLWSILELFEQKKRVKKGWFPSNPKKNK